LSHAALHWQCEGIYDVHRRPEGKTATDKGWRGNLADQAIGRIEARLVLLLLSKIVIPVK
jgi:hypothetical protein